MKFIKWLLIVVATLLLGAIGYFIISSRLSMDSNFTHTAATAELPLIGSYAGDGIVRIPVGAFEFRARVAGLDNEAGETVILLHGFPVTSAMWEPLMQPLADAGYRAIAFDQRGYSPGARPEEESAYATQAITADVLDLADAVEATQFHLIGHDWGAGIGWNTVINHPQRVLSWTGLSIAHPIAFTEALQNDPDQQSRSGYFALFATPGLPEVLFTFGDFKALKAIFGPMPETHLNEYLQVFAEPGALTAALNWYRQMGESLLAVESPNPIIETPTLFIWGNNDPSAGRAAVEGQAQYMKGPYEFIELDGQHWLMETHAKTIVPAVIKHLRRVTETLKESQLAK